MAAALIALDIAIPHKALDTISAVYFGLIVGLFLTYVVGLGMEGLPIMPAVDRAIRLVLGMVLCYGCISLLLQTKDDFRFIIPYVEFSKEVKGAQALRAGHQRGDRRPHRRRRRYARSSTPSSSCRASCSTSCRPSPTAPTACAAAAAAAGWTSSTACAAAASSICRSSTASCRSSPARPVDLKLVLLAKHLEGKVVTNDYNLNKVAKLHGVGVVNLNDLANALKPVFLPGETWRCGSSSRAKSPAKASAISTTARWSSSKAAASTSTGM